MINFYNGFYLALIEVIRIIHYSLDEGYTLSYMKSLPYSLLVQDIYSAASLIFIGQFLGGMIIIARKLNVVSDIGRELGSLSNLVTLGLALSGIFLLHPSSGCCACQFIGFAVHFVSPNLMLVKLHLLHLLECLLPLQEFVLSR